MSNQHLLFQTVHIAKNDAEYNLQVLDKFMDKLEDRLNQLETLFDDLPAPHLKRTVTA